MSLDPKYLDITNLYMDCCEHKQQAGEHCALIVLTKVSATQLKVFELYPVINFQTS